MNAHGAEVDGAKPQSTFSSRARERRSLEAVLGGRLSADNLVPFMLRGVV